MTTRHRAQARANAQLAAAEQSRRAKQHTPDIDWDKAILLIRATLQRVRR